MIAGDENKAELYEEKRGKEKGPINKRGFQNVLLLVRFAPEQAGRFALWSIRPLDNSVFSSFRHLVDSPATLYVRSWDNSPPEQFATLTFRIGA